MSKGKKKVHGIPVIDTRKGVAKLKPLTKPKPPKKVKKNPSPQMGAMQNGFYKLAQQPQTFNYLGVDTGWFLQEYTADVEPDKIKKPTVGDWAEEWYEKQKKLG